MNKAVIFGTAIDGPKNKAFIGTSMQDYLNQFGGVFNETSVVSPSASSLDLTFEPFDAISDIVVNRGPNHLFSPEISNTTLTFGPLGGSTNLSIELYYRPYLGYSDLITAVESYYNATGEFPYVVRCGGEFAEASIDDWEFTSAYPGELYNSISITVTASSSISVSGDSRFPVSNYDIDTIEEHMTQDFYNGLCPIRIKTKGTTVTNGIYNLTGGTTGTITSTSLETALDQTSLPFIPIATVLKEFESTDGAVISNFVRDEGAMMFVFGPCSGENTEILDNTLNAESWDKSNYIISVQGTNLSRFQNRLIERYNNEPIVNALVRSKTNQITNLKLPIFSLLTDYSEEDLDILFERGYVGLVRKIRSGLSPYKGVLTSKEDLLFYLLECQIRSEVNIVLSKYLAKALKPGSQPSIEKEVINVLRPIDNFDTRSVNVTVYKNADELFLTDKSGNIVIGSYLVCQITGLTYSEIFEITIHVQVRAK